MTFYTVRPLDTPPRLTNGIESLFRANWSATEQLLAAELGFLDAAQVVLMIDVSEGDLRLDGRLRANAQPKSPAVALTFNSRYGPLRYDCHRYNRWQDNVRAIGLGLEALRKIDRYGISHSDEQYRGYRALPSADDGRAGPMSREEAAEFIADQGTRLPWMDDGEREGPSPKLVASLLLPDPSPLDLRVAKELVRAAARRLHPDTAVTGNADEFVKLTAAREVLGL